VSRAQSSAYAPFCSALRSKGSGENRHKIDLGPPGISGKPQDLRTLCGTAKYTDEQASRGNAAFSTTYANCLTLDSQASRPLSGKAVWDTYTQKTAGDLFTFIQKNLPNVSTVPRTSVTESHSLRPF
jgi:hypothetical protein